MSATTTEKAELLYDVKSILGEGPVWDWIKQRLIWVDIEGRRLYEHNPLNGKNRHWDFGQMVGAAVPKKDGNILLALESGLASFDPEESTLVDHPALKNTDPLMRYNDGKVGPDGNFWIGSMHKEFLAHSGNLFRVTKDFETMVQIPKTTISNGMAWTADHKIFYYIDSPSFEVCAFDFDLASGTISNKRSVLSIPEPFGSPDGMTIDSNDMLWVAHWGGGCVRQWNPITGEVLLTIKVDAPHVTSCCFGGKNLDTLYITSARSGLDALRGKTYPFSGGLFQYKPKAKGKPITYF